MAKSQLTFPDYLSQDTEFKKYGRNDVAIFALSMYLGIDEVDEFVSSSLTEHPSDKDIDIFYIDLSKGRAAIVQMYISNKFGNSAAPSKKASDLNTACAWTFSADETTIPNKIRPKAIELRNAIINDEIERIDFLYVHNCKESVNVENELKTVTDGARDKIIALTGRKPHKIQLVYKEIGIKAIEDLYRATDKEILVEDVLSLPKGDFIKEKGDDWQAIQLTIEGNWIRELYLNNGDNLFSANYRDYLGSFKRKGNINYEIAKTAEKEPQSFWVYNNGITALTNKIITNKKIQFHGLSIINGAQTTGALAEASEEKAKSIKVSLRVVECKNKEKVNKIIKYNNTQNEIKAFDKRSGDKTQKRLAKDFFEKYSINYVHRRKQTRAPKNAITAHSVAPILCSFHGEPNIAHRHATEIFLQDDIYKKVFNDIIKVEHIFLLKKLSTAIDEYKKYLNDRVKEGEATEDDKDQQELLKYSASKTFIFYIIGRLAEVILNRRVTNLYNWMAKTDLISQDNTSIAKGWREVIQTILPHIVFVLKQKKDKDNITNPFYEVPRSFEHSKKVGDELKALLSSLLPTIGKQFDNIRKRTII